MIRAIRSDKTARARDAFWCVVGSGLPAALAFALYKKTSVRAENWHLAVIWLGVAATAVWLVGILRWRIYGHLDSGGISVRPSREAAADDLPWSEVEEIFLGAGLDFELRGGGRRVRVPRGVEVARDLWAEMHVRALPVVRERLRGRMNEGVSLSFRGPRSRPWLYRAITAAMLAVAVAHVPGVRSPLAAVAVAGSLFLWLRVFWEAREVASWLTAEVVVAPEVLGIRRLGREQRFLRAELGEAQLDRRGWLVIPRPDARPLRIPPVLANFRFLTELLRDGRLSE